VQQNHDWDWTAADASFRRALELAPGDAHVLDGAASLARILGQHEKALGLIRKALALDPLSAAIHREAAMVYLMSDRLEDAATSLQMALDLNPKGGLTHACCREAARRRCRWRRPNPTMSSATWPSR